MAGSSTLKVLNNKPVFFFSYYVRSDPWILSCERWRRYFTIFLVSSKHFGLRTSDHRCSRRHLTPTLTMTTVQPEEFKFRFVLHCLHHEHQLLSALREWRLGHVRAGRYVRHLPPDFLIFTAGTEEGLLTLHVRSLFHARSGRLCIFIKVQKGFFYFHPLEKKIKQKRANASGVLCRALRSGLRWHRDLEVKRPAFMTKLGSDF